MCSYPTFEGYTSRALNFVGNDLVHAPQQATVCVEREVDLAAAEPTLPDLDARSLREHQRCRCMTQVVEADIGQPRLPEQRHATRFTLRG